jgi:hypothetical protein
MSVVGCPGPFCLTLERGSGAGQGCGISFVPSTLWDFSHVTPGHLPPGHALNPRDAGNHPPSDQAMMRSAFGTARNRAELRSPR